MPITVHTTNQAPSGAGPYSQAVRAGDFLFLSGIGALDVDSHAIQGDTAGDSIRHGHWQDYATADLIRVLAAAFIDMQLLSYGT
ncbi:hypothetical protein ROA7450_02047 [Roseovarius albus]|uniref:RidA family protein n=1 Tax=Roseovarius albus TaxID=1247867 RepID=A0A1X6Z793_9RHOB|nr:hypothetical protein [Roseovarius albus]SLN42173.1 hypothetical protein ROA7450_02047 [Roseovarius albus]